MGCGSQMGCLGPKPREREVYVDLIETIYQQAESISFKEDEDIYEIVKTRITKKGLLRKLIDNLISHKSHINECLHKFYELISKNSQTQVRVAGLVIFDRIVQEFINQSKQNFNQQKTKTAGPLLSIFKKKEKTKQVELQGSSIELHQYIDSVYFKLMLILLRQQKILLSKILMSMQGILSLRFGKITCQKEVYEMFHTLIQIVKQQQYQKEILHIFLLILQNFKSSNKSDNNREFIIFFLFQLFQNKSEPLIRGYTDILLEYTNRYFGDYRIIYQSILTVLDDCQFERTKSEKIDEYLIQNGEKNIEYKQKFSRGLLISLLKYLQTVQKDSQINIYSHVFKEKTKKNGFKQLSCWIKIFNIDFNQFIKYNSQQFILTFFKNIYLSQSDDLKKQLSREFYSIVKSLDDNSNKVLANFIVEQIKNNQISDSKRRLLFEAYQYILNERQTLFTNLQNLIDLKYIISIEKYYQSDFNRLLLNIILPNIKKVDFGPVKKSYEAYSHFKMMISSFLYSVYQCVNLIDYDNPKQYIKGNIKKIYQYVSETLKVIKYLSQNKLSILVIPYIEKLNKGLGFIDLIQIKQNIVIYFYLSYLIENSIFLINKKQRVNPLLTKIWMKLEIDLQIDDIIKETWNLVQYNDIKDENSLEQNNQTQEDKSVQAAIKQNKKKIDILFELSMANPMQIKQIADIYRQLFHSFKKASLKLNHQLSTFQQSFQRKSSMQFPVGQKSERHSSRNEQQQDSFNDILDKIKQF